MSTGATAGNGISLRVWQNFPSHREYQSAQPSNIDENTELQQ
jgi:hypothetical protein